MDHISTEDLLTFVAPCSLICYTCPACKDGAISQCSAKLCTYYEGYYDFNDANIPVEYRGWLDDFKKFYTMLEHDTHSSCPTCRKYPENSRGCIENCVVRDCYKKKNVDYCAECPDFPCNKAKDFFVQVNDKIAGDWIRGNERIKEIGIRQYFEEKKDVSHYISYKKSSE